MRLSLLTATLLTVVIPAQSVTLNVTNIAPLAIEARVGAQLQSASWPAGPLPQIAYLSAVSPAGPQGSAEVFLNCNYVDGLQPSVGLRAIANSVSVAGTAVSTTTHLIDLLVQVQASATVRANLEFDRAVRATAGAAAPLQRIDVGNDGTFEITETSTPGFSVRDLVLGPQALPIRVQLEISTTGTQSIVASLGLRLVAENDLFISPAISGCASDYFYVLPSFERAGIDIGVQTMIFGDLSAAVFGLGVQPTVIGHLLPSCVLLPSQDLVLLLPAYGTVNLAVPANLRPFTAWAQAVVLVGTYLGDWQGELTTTQGYRIDAR